MKVVIEIFLKFFINRFEETNEKGETCNPGDKCVGGLARTIATVKTLNRTRPNAIFVNSGDNSRGTFLYLVGGLPVVSRLMNVYPPDANVIISRL